MSKKVTSNKAGTENITIGTSKSVHQCPAKYFMKKQEY